MLRHTIIPGLFSLLLFNCSSTGLIVEVQNPLQVKRSEIISLQRSQLSEKLDCDLPLQVVDYRGGNLLPVQFLDLDQDHSWEAMLIQVNMDPLETRKLSIENVESVRNDSESKVFGRFVPERKDDFAWENDRIAFRMYGPALEATGEISSGVDVWVKSVDYPIIDKWYAHGKYHKDEGEGADLYKVGPTLGCGGLGLLYNDSLYTSKNFSDYRILAEGPLRFVFELDYAEWGPEEYRLIETKRISLDMGSHFNRIESRVTGINPASEKPVFVAGLLAHPQHSDIPVSINRSDSYLMMYEGIQGNNGEIGSGVILDAGAGKTSIKQYGDQYLLPLQISSSGEVSYRAGAGWSKSPWFASEETWTDLIRSHINQTSEPLKIKIIN